MRFLIPLGVLFNALALAFFYAMERHWLSDHAMTPIFMNLFMAYDFRSAWLSFCVCLLAAFWTKPAPIHKVVDFMGDRPLSIALVVAVLAALAANLVYHNVALSMDEYAAVFQAKVFAAGRLTAQLPAAAIDWLIPPGFNGTFLVASHSTGRAMEAYWPGFALLLTPFEFLKAPWACNALLTLLALLLIHRITFEVTADRRAAGWSVLFAVASGAFIAYAISNYSMQAHLCANLLFAWLLSKPSKTRALLAGVVGSLALVLHNPFPHFMFAAPWIVATAFSQQRRKYFFPLALGYLPLLLVLGAGWLQLRSTVTAGDAAFTLVGHSIHAVFSWPDAALLNMRAAAAVKMWIWAVPCLFIFAAVGARRFAADQRVLLLAASAILTFVGYLFVIFDQGHGWGYRYFQSAFGVIPILAACALARRGEPRERLAAFAGALAILNMLVVVPFQLWQIEQFITRHSAELPAAVRPGNNVYFVHVPGAFYAGDLVQVDPSLRGEDLILFSRGPLLDGELRAQNWPNATLAARGLGIEEWHIAGPQGAARFVISFAPPEHHPR